MQPDVVVIIVPMTTRGQITIDKDDLGRWQFGQESVDEWQRPCASADDEVVARGKILGDWAHDHVGRVMVGTSS